MIRSLAFLLLGALLTASAQDSTSASHSSSIAGVVVKEPGSQPLKKVMVQVVAEDQKQAGNYTVTTDADGHFRIENIQPGRYRIFIEKTGFVGMNGRGHRADTNVYTIQPGHSVEDVLCRMWPAATIIGRITDEDGDPMSGITVFAQKKRPGKATREATENSSTNDLGEYRLSGLFPSQYWIVAMPPPDFRDYEQERGKSQAGDYHGDAHSDTRYLTTYYPGTYDGAQAAAVTLKAGDEMPLNIRLVPARTYRVRGSVTGIAAGQKPIVKLVSRTGVFIHESEAGPDGQFEVRGVGPGSYVLKASASATADSPITAGQDVSVVAADVEGLKLAPQPSFALSGHLYIEGNFAGALTQYSINLRPAELPDDPGFFLSQEFVGWNAPVDRLGNFEWKNVNPGNYIVQLYGGDGQSGAFLKSVKIGGQDGETGFRAAGPAILDLIVSTKGGAIEGAVFENEKEKEMDAQHPVANATVVAVPEERYRKLPGRFSVGETDQHGRFTIRGLAPGNYTLYAWQDLEESVYRDPEFLKSQEANAAILKVEEGSRQQVELKLSPTPDEWH
jgi:Carboxypeptidase regulatory-like domain